MDSNFFFAVSVLKNEKKKCIVKRKIILYNKKEGLSHNLVYLRCIATTSGIYDYI